MTNIANKTGGRYLKLDDVNQLPDAFRQIATDLTQQYMLGYEPQAVSKDGERRKITVKVNIPNVAVRSRNEVVFKKK